MAVSDIHAAPAARRLAEENHVDLSSVKATGPGGRILKEDVMAHLKSGVETSPASGTRQFVSPAARRVAAEKNIDLSSLPGSGPSGRIILRDLIDRAGTAAASADVAGLPPFTEVRLSAMRKTIARRMTEAKSTIPHFYLSVDVQMDRLLDLRKQLNEVAEKGKVSVNDLLIRATALALGKVPEVNVQYADTVLRQFDRADISVAVAIKGGLITPVLRDAGNKDVYHIGREMADLAEKARAGKLVPEDYTGGCISLSNLGMFGIDQFSAIINPPQAAILAMGTASKRPWVVGDEVVPRTIMTITMACDHRAIDGAQGATFLQALQELIEGPIALVV